MRPVDLGFHFGMYFPKKDIVDIVIVNVPNVGIVILFQRMYEGRPTGNNYIVAENAIKKMTFLHEKQESTRASELETGRGWVLGKTSSYCTEENMEFVAKIVKKLRNGILGSMAFLDKRDAVIGGHLVKVL